MNYRNRLSRIFVFIVCSAILTVFYGNCSNDVNFSDKQQEKSKEPNPVEIGDQLDDVDSPPDLPDNPDEDDIRTLCEKVRNEVKEYSFFFDNPKNLASDPKDTCSFGKNNNLGHRNEYFQARIEQRQAFKLPPRAALCGMEFNFISDTQPFVYDDHFMMTLNNYVIAASYDWSENFKQLQGLLVYDWFDLQGDFWGGNNNPKERTYCAGESEGLSQCTWPETEHVGQIKVELGDSVIYRLVAMSPELNSHEFGFVTTGDNDPSTDCQHSPFAFNIKARYVLTQ